MNIYNISIEHATASDGERFFCLIPQGRSPIWFAARVAELSKPKLLEVLADKGLRLSDQHDYDRFYRLLGERTPFAGQPPMNRTGWVGSRFVAADGTIFKAAKADAGPVILQRELPLKTYAGRFDRWLKDVAVPLTRQPYLMFIVQAALAAPLARVAGRRTDMLFEFIVPNAADRSLLVALAHSVIGSISLHARNGALPFSEALGDISKRNAEYADSLMVLNDAELFMSAEAASRRATSLRSFPSRPSGQGYADHVFGHIAMLIGSRGLVTLAGEDTEIGQLAASRMLQIEVRADRPLGIFSTMPSGAENIAKFVDQLNEAARRNYGLLLRRFLRKLVREQVKHPNRLRKRIEAYMAEFREHAKVDMNKTGAVQVADAFGLVFAAGEMGKAWGLLPEKWHCGNAALLPFRQVPFTQQSLASFDNQLLDLANASDTIDLDNLAADVEADTIAKAKVFVRKRAGESRIMIRIDAIGEKIAHWRARQSMPDVIARAIRERGRATVYVRLSKGERVRMYAFKLPTK